MVITFACCICTKTIGDNGSSLYGDKCNLWVHIKCYNLNFIVYQYLNGMTTLGFVSNVKLSDFHLVP